jgi:carboxymethylenebutenolidase
MCDEFTELDADAALARRGLTRRAFAARGCYGLAGAAALIGCTGASEPPLPPLGEKAVRITTPDGVADGFLVHPAKGRHPGILMWPDIAGLREAYKAMARRLAASGYTVLAVNQYYRNAPAPVLESFAGWLAPAGQAKVKPMIAALNPERTTRDAAAFLAFLDTLPQVDTRRRLGVCGYCMGGPFAVRSAVAAPDRVGAVATLHGTSLVGPASDSPHRLLGQTHAAFLFAIARNDDVRAPGDKDALRAAAAAAGRPAEIEVYAADHGWCALDAPSYDRAEAERAGGRMEALFARL